MNQVYREEKKFLLNLEEFRKLAHHLEHFLMEDEHNGALGYRVRSLYFDTMYDKDYFEKLDDADKWEIIEFTKIKTHRYIVSCFGE